MTKEQILQTFPPSLARDERLLALGETVAAAFSDAWEDLGNVSVYPDVFQLPESLLDVLAYDFKVDWWDSDDPLAAKRQIFYDSFAVRRGIGTKGAVATALSSVYGTAYVTEWFEYDGEPYHFKVDINVGQTGISEALLWKIYYQTMWYKNVRSLLESIDVRVEYEDTLHAGGVLNPRQSVEIVPYLETLVESSGEAIAGGVLNPRQSLEITPYLETLVESSGEAIAGGVLNPRQSVEIAPYLACFVGGTLYLAAVGFSCFRQAIEVSPLVAFSK